MFLLSSSFLRLLAAGVFIGAAATAGFAQTCHVTCPDGTSMKVSCDTTVDPCPLRDFAAPPALGTPEWSAAFSRLTDVLTRLRVQQPSLLKDQPVPVTYADLLSQTNAMFDEAAYQLDGLNLRNRWLAEQIVKLDLELRALFSSHDELVIRRTILPGEKTGARAEFARAQRAAEAKRMPVVSLQRAADAMRDRAQRAAQDCIYWLAVAEPPGVAPISERALAARVRSVREPLSWEQPPAGAAMMMSPSAPPKEEFNLVATHRPLPGGSVADRLSVVEGLIPQLADATELRYRNETAFDFKSSAAVNLRSKVATLMAAVARSQAELNSLQVSAASLRATAPKELQADQARALGNLRRSAAEAFVLEAYRDQILIPEVRRFLSANQVSPTLDHASLVRIYQNKATLLPRPNAGSYVELNRLMDVQKRTATILSDYRLFAGEAAMTVRTDGATQARSIRADVMRNLGRGRPNLLHGFEHEGDALAKIARAVLAP
jgi:hypothetical protein